MIQQKIDGFIKIVIKFKKFKKENLSTNTMSKNLLLNIFFNINFPIFLKLYLCAL